MKKILILLSLLSSISFATKNDTCYLDKTHKTLSDWVYNTSNSLDLFFAKKDINSLQSTGSYLDLSLDSYLEERKKTNYRLNVKFRLKLPRTQKRLNIVFEDYKKTLSIDKQNSDTVGNSLENNSYILGIQMEKLKSKYMQANFGGGIRFSGISPDTYISIYIGKDFYNFSNWQLEFNNQVRYFAKRGLDNTANISLSKVLNQNIKFSFQNSYHFIKNRNRLNEVSNSFIVEQYVGKNRGFSYLASIYSFSDRDRNFKINYYLAKVTYKRYFYHNFAYYELSPGLIFRREDDFKPNARIVFKIGIFFGKTAHTAYKRFE